MNTITASEIEIFAIDQIGYEYVYGPYSETPRPTIVFGEVKGKA